MKAPGSTGEGHAILIDSKAGEGSGIPGVVVKCVDIGRNTKGKPADWHDADTEVRKRGERTGLDTRVVHAVNDGH